MQNSNLFQKEFLNLINLDIIQKHSEELEIRTQQYWATDEDDEDDEDNNRSGFFDFEIQSMPKANGKRDFLAVIESKIGAPFRRDQLENYRAELKKKAVEYQQCYLITLTNHSQKPPLADAHIKWSQVHELLSKTAIEEKLTIIYKQFADFLKMKGLAPMNIVKISPNQLFKDGIEFACQIPQFLLHVRNNASLKDNADLRDILGSRVYPHEEDDGSRWAKITGKKDQPSLALYFKVWPDYEMLVETFWINRPSGDPEKCFNKQEMANKNFHFQVWENGKGFGIQGEFTSGSDYDGNAVKIKEWFEEAVNFALKLRKGIYCE